MEINIKVKFLCKLNISCLLFLQEIIVTICIYIYSIYEIFTVK